MIKPKKTIYRTIKTKENTLMVDINLINNPELSHEEVGFMARLLLEKDDYNFSIKDFLNKYPDGRDKNYRIYNSLKSKGFITCEQINEGNFGSNTVIVSEASVYWKPVYGKPVNGKINSCEQKPTITIDNKEIDPLTGNPYTGNQYTGSPFTGNQYTGKTAVNTELEAGEKQPEDIYIYINNINSKYINNIDIDIDIQEEIIDLATMGNFKFLQNIQTVNKIVLFHKKPVLKFWLSKIKLIHDALQTRLDKDKKDGLSYVLTAIYSSYSQKKQLKDKLPEWIELFEKSQKVDENKGLTSLFNSNRHSLSESFIAFGKNLVDETLLYFDFKAGKTPNMGKHTKDIFKCLEIENFDRVLGILDDVFIKDKYSLLKSDRKFYSLESVEEVKNILVNLKNTVHSCEQV